MKYKYMLFVLLFLVFLGCQNNANNQANKFTTKKIDLTAPESNEALRLSELIEDFYFVKLKSSKKTGSIDKTIIYEDEITIMDKQNDAIVSYDMDGNEKVRIDQHGKGPGEFSRINSFTKNPIDNSYIIHADFGRLMKFNTDGDYIGEVRLNLSVLDIIATSDNGLVVLTGFNDRSLPFALTEIEIGLDEIISSMLPCGEREFNSTFISDTYFSTCDNEFLVIDQFNGIVYEFNFPMHDNLKNSITSKYILDFGDENLPLNVSINPRKNLSELQHYRFLHGSAIKAGHVLSINTIKGTSNKNHWINLNSNGQKTNSDYYELDNYLFSWIGGALQCSHNGYFVKVHDGYDLNKSLEIYKKYLKDYFPDKTGGFTKFLNQNNLGDVGVGDEPVFTFFKFR